MFWIILSIIAIGILIFFTGWTTVIVKPDSPSWSTSYSDRVWKLNKKSFFSLFGLIFLIFGFITIIPANSVGIVYSPFSGTSTQTLAEGIHTKFILDRIYVISTETQTRTVSNLTTQTKDAQFLDSTIDIKYKVSEENAYLVFKQYRTLDKLSENFVVPTMQRVLELVTTQYNVIDVLGESRADIYENLNQALADEFVRYGVDYISISIVDMDAGEALESAITAEAVAKKQVETAQQELEKTKTEAQKKAVEAQAEQDAAKIKAETLKIEAQAEKDANAFLNQSLTEEILRMQWIDKWNGVVPTYYGGDANLMIGIE